MITKTHNLLPDIERKTPMLITMLKIVSWEEENEGKDSMISSIILNTESNPELHYSSNRQWYLKEVERNTQRL